MPGINPVTTTYDLHGRPLVRSIGRHRVSCEREGYATRVEEVDIPESALARFSCDLQPNPGLVSGRQGILTFAFAGEGQVRVDGRRAGRTVVVPRGIHTVQVSRFGFEDWTQTVTARPGFPQSIAVISKMTPEHALILENATRSRRTWAYVIGSAGLAALGTGVALFADNSHRYQTWQDNRGLLSRDISARDDSSNLDARLSSVHQSAASIQRQDDIALGATVLGGALVSYALISWLTAK